MYLINIYSTYIDGHPSILRYFYNIVGMIFAPSTPLLNIEINILNVNIQQTLERI